jgi:3-hydroxyacyl-CoA dehydrogenase/enoyl-CoA hydratase/3-hydroxybutyryl-CoA epimerase
MINKHIKYSIDNDGIAVVTWDVADSPVNIMNEAMAEFFSTINQAIADDVVKGIVIASLKKKIL